MANKFLPFIVENSTPINIFQTLISRSKGMNLVTVGSIFNLVLQGNLKEIRNYAKKLPDMPMEKLYTALIEKFSIYRVDDKDIQLFLAMSKYLSEANWSEKLNEFDWKDIMVFFTVMANVPEKLQEYTDIPFGNVYTEQDTVLNNIQKYLKFSDTGHTIIFESSEDLKAYIIYRSILNKTPGPSSICAKFTNVKTKEV